MLYSTSAYEATREWGSDTYYFGKQALISLAAFVMLLIGSQIDYHFYIRWSDKLYYLSVALLIATRFIGRTINGARRWIYIGPISFQPAELAKLAIILFLPFTITSMSKESMKGFKAPVLILVFGGLSAFCTFVFTDNLSTAVIIMGIAVILTFIVHDKTKPFVIIFLVERSLVLPLILIAVIELGIFINLGIPHYLGQTLPFIAPICISTIQLGATVDYAILLTTIYKNKRIGGLGKKEAVKDAAALAIPSIIVSGLGLFAATIGVALYSRIDIIDSICMLLSRGAIISILMVIFLLPPMLLLFDRPICATTIGMQGIYKKEKLS